MLKLAIDPKRARESRAKAPSKDNDVCSMCGEFCAYKVMDDATEREKANAAA